MLEHKRIEHLDDYFLELSKRKEKGVFFYRINGISEEVRSFLCKYYDSARKQGVIIEGRIANPTEGNLSYYNEIMGMDFKMEESFIDMSLKKWLPRMSDAQRGLVSSSIYNSLDDMLKHGKTENMLKNAYIKYMCWLYYKFERIVGQLGQDTLPKILYEGNISTYELMLISILSNAGCDVLLVQSDEDQAYKKADPSLQLSELYEADLEKMPSDFSIRKMIEEKMKAEAPKPKVVNVARPDRDARTNVNVTQASNPETSASNPVNISRPDRENRSNLNINLSRTSNTSSSSTGTVGAQTQGQQSETSGQVQQPRRNLNLSGIGGNTPQRNINIGTSPASANTGQATSQSTPQTSGGLHINVSRSSSLNRNNTVNTNNSVVANHNNTGGIEPVHLGPVIRCTNAWIEGEGLQDILQATAMRGNDNNLFYNCFCRINGVVDRLTYANELYQFYLSLKNAKRHVVIVNKIIPKPTTDEIMGVKRANYVRLEQVLAGLRANIQYPANPELRDIMVRAFEEILTEESKVSDGNINKLINKGVYLLCWLKRYQSELFKSWKKPDIGCFIYFGGCRDANEAMFMRFLARLPIDVLILCPNQNEKCCLEDRTLYEINYENSMILSEFPAQNAQLHIGTAAYHAERDLDKIMYNDSVIFRDQQFTKANTISLQTMDREIKILWNNDLKFRPNFSTVDGVVNIPVVFSKMSGVKDGKVDEYWISIKQLMTPETLVIDQAPFIKSNTPNPVKMYATEFFKNGKLQRSRIKNHQSYQYGFLREDMQEHLLDKLEMMIEQRLIKGTFENGTEYTIISVALNLPKDVTRLIQKFDFTKKNPKLIYVNAAESLISLEDTIYVTFLNLIGFDVVFFIPTGYNIEGYFNKKLMEEHQLGDYVYDLQVPNWETVPLTAQKSWKDKFFKKG